MALDTSILESSTTSRLVDLLRGLDACTYTSTQASTCLAYLNRTAVLQNRKPDTQTQVSQTTWQAGSRQHNAALLWISILFTFFIMIFGAFTGALRMPASQPAAALCHADYRLQPNATITVAATTTSAICLPACYSGAIIIIGGVSMHSERENI